MLRVEQFVQEYNIRTTPFLKHRTNWDNVRCAVRSFTLSTILKLDDPLDAFNRAIGEVIAIGLFLRLFCAVDLDSSNCLMPAGIELMMLSRLLIMHGVEHAVQIIGVYLRLLVLGLRGSMVLQGSHKMKASGILFNTPPVHINGERHLNAHSLVLHRAAAAAHPLEFYVSRYRTYQFATCFLQAQTRVCNDLHYTVFDIEC